MEYVIGIGVVIAAVILLLAAGYVKSQIGRAHV